MHAGTSPLNSMEWGRSDASETESCLQMETRMRCVRITRADWRAMAGEIGSGDIHGSRTDDCGVFGDGALGIGGQGGELKLRVARGIGLAGVPRPHYDVPTSRELALNPAQSRPNSPYAFVGLQNLRRMPGDSFGLKPLSSENSLSYASLVRATTPQ
jgi:hypothetical protein